MYLYMYVYVYIYIYIYICNEHGKEAQVRSQLRIQARRWGSAPATCSSRCANKKRAAGPQIRRQQSDSKHITINT